MEDLILVVRSRKSKDRQHNGQKKKNKWRNNDLPYTTQKMQHEKPIFSRAAWKRQNIFPVLIYTAVNVLCSRECLNITFLQLSIFRCYFLKHIYISSKSVSTLQITVKPVYKGHSNEPEQYGLCVVLYIQVNIIIFINGKYVTALNRQCFVI